MKRRNKYSAIIVAALLAVTPIVLNNTNTVNADPMPKATNNNDNTVTNDDGKQVNIKSIDDIKNENPKHVTYKYDDNMTHDIKYRDNLTTDDVLSYFGNHAHILADGKEIKFHSTPYMAKNSNNQDIVIDKQHQNPTLGKGFTISASVDIPNSGLDKNTWYEWNQKSRINERCKALGRPLSDEIIDQLAQSKTNDSYTVAEKTDEHGNLPTILLHKETNKNFETIDDFNREIAPNWIFNITDDANALDIPHIEYQKHATPATTVKPQVTDPADELPNPSTDTPTSIIDQSGSKPEMPLTSPTQPSDPKDSQTQPTKPVESNFVLKSKMISHNAFIYDKNGKLVKQHGMFIIKRKDQPITLLDNGKKHKIKGHLFYRIGKNKFIKVNNVKDRPVAYKFEKTGSIKKNFIRLYNANGKYLKKHISKKNIQFNAKMTIKGHLYYRIKNTNNWVRANQVKINK